MKTLVLYSLTILYFKNKRLHINEKSCILIKKILNKKSKVMNFATYHLPWVLHFVITNLCMLYVSLFVHIEANFRKVRLEFIHLNFVDEIQTVINWDHVKAKKLYICSHL